MKKNDFTTFEGISEFLDKMHNALLNEDMDEYAKCFKVFAMNVDNSIFYNEDPLDFIIDSLACGEKEYADKAIELRKLQISLMLELGLNEKANVWISLGERYGL